MSFKTYKVELVKKPRGFLTNWTLKETSELKKKSQMSLLSFPNDVLKLILRWLPLRNLCSSTTVCTRFNKIIPELLEIEALQGRLINPHFVEAHQLLKPKLKIWQYYLLLRLSFTEVEEDSIKFILPYVALTTAFYQNRSDLLAEWIPSVFQDLKKRKSDTIGNFYHLVEICTIYSRKECFLTLIKYWPELPTKLRKFPATIPVGFFSLFSEEEKKYIIQRLKCIPPKIIFLAKKFTNGSLQLDKLPHTDQVLAYDCYPEDRIDLLKANGNLKRWAYYRHQCQRGHVLNSCDTHFKWTHPFERIYIYYDCLLKDKGFKDGINYHPHDHPEWCLEYEMNECEADVKRQTKDLPDLNAKMMISMISQVMKNSQERTEKEAKIKEKEKILEAILNKASQVIKNSNERTEKEAKIKEKEKILEAILNKARQGTEVLTLEEFGLLERLNKSIARQKEILGSDLDKDIIEITAITLLAEELVNEESTIPSKDNMPKFDD